MKNLILVGKVVIKLKQILKLLSASENMLSFVELFAMVLRFHCSKKCEKNTEVRLDRMVKMRKSYPFCAIFTH